MAELLIRGAVCLAVFGGPALLPPSAQAASPEASWFVGTWRCTAKDGTSTFTWRVQDRLEGPWLTGEGQEDGRATSLDVWAVAADGTLGVRRQFSPRGFYLELDVATSGEMSLRLEGFATKDDIGFIPVRESIRFTSRRSFDALWETQQNGRWQTMADETCTALD